LDSDQIEPELPHVGVEARNIGTALALIDTDLCKRVVPMMNPYSFLRLMIVAIGVSFYRVRTTWRFLDANS
jgi:hypothetical protein